MAGLAFYVAVQTSKTVDETWIHHLTLLSKQQSKLWVSACEPAPKTVKSAGKVMAVSWDASTAHKKDEQIKSAYYRSLLGRLSHEIKNNRPHLAIINISFINAIYGTIPLQFLWLTLEPLPYPPYSPDLTLWNHFYLLTWIPQKEILGEQ